MRSAEQQRLTEIESLRMNGEDLRTKLKEAVEENEKIAREFKQCKHENEQLVGNLLADAVIVENSIRGTLSFATFPLCVLSSFP